MNLRLTSNLAVDMIPINHDLYDLSDNESIDSSQSGEIYAVQGLENLVTTSKVNPASYPYNK